MSNNGIYIAAAGGMAQYERLEHLTNNLANVSTAGFKGDRPIFSVVRPDYTGQLRFHPMRGSAEEVRATAFAKLDEVSLDMRQGSFENTDDPLSMALGGEGFFTVAAPEGTLYTRSGQFRLDAEGRLVTADGLPVLGQGDSEIFIQGGDVNVGADGQITVDGKAVGTLKIATFDDDTHLARVGHTLFRALAPDGTPAEAKPMGHAQVMQGVLESSNVNPIVAMTELIDTNRAFEQFTKSLQALDGLDEKAIAQMARPK